MSEAIFEYIKNLSLRFFGLFRAKKEAIPTVENNTNDQETYAAEVTKYCLEGSISTFLWKPVSDYDGNVLVAVTCDNVRRDLYMEILGKSGKALKVNISNSLAEETEEVEGDLVRLKYSRVYFEVARKAINFNKSAPLIIKFYQYNNINEPIPVKVMGKSFIKITRPTVRKNLK